MLVLALALATVFVVLSAWQFEQSRTEHSYAEDTETAVELTEIYEPALPISIHEADRIVNLTGEFVPGTHLMVDSRLQDGEDGYWAVAAFRVEDAPGDEVIPVVLGWTDDTGWLDDGGSFFSGPRRYQDEPYADSPQPGLMSDLTIQGRLLPTEAPGPGPRDLPDGVLPTLSAAELINLWDEDSYSGFVVAFDLEHESGVPLSQQDLGLEPVWVGPQPERNDINWLNLFYAVEWVVFAGFAFYLWWRLVKDAHERELEEERLDREWAEQWREEQLAKQTATDPERTGTSPDQDSVEERR